MTERKNTVTALEGRKPAQRRTRKSAEAGKPADVVDLKTGTVVSDSAKGSDGNAGSLDLSTGELKVPAAPKAEAKTETKKAVSTKLVVLPEDLEKLVFTADIHKKPVTRHLGDRCHYFDKKWGNETTFSKVTDPKRLAELKPCSACATRVARERVNAEKAAAKK